MEYDTIICFETHVELKTETKLFCNCSVEYEASPNSHICPVCTGQPGALPVLNKKAVKYTIMAGLALNCTINRMSRFARKNYFTLTCRKDIKYHNMRGHFVKMDIWK